MQPDGTQLVLREAAAEQADRRQPRLARRLGIVRRVSHDDRLLGRHAVQLRQRRLEDVGVRLRPLGVVGRRGLLDQVVDAGDLLVSVEFLPLGRRGEHDLLAIPLDPLEEFAGHRERVDPGEVLALEELGALLLDPLTIAFHLLLGQEDGHELVAPLADLVPDLLERDLMTVFREDLLPGPGMEVVGIDERPVHVENHGLDHRVACSLGSRPGRTLARRMARRAASHRKCRANGVRRLGSPLSAARILRRPAPNGYVD